MKRRVDGHKSMKIAFRDRSEDHDVRLLFVLARVVVIVDSGFAELKDDHNTRRKINLDERSKSFHPHGRITSLSLEQGLWVLQVSLTVD